MATQSMTQHLSVCFLADGHPSNLTHNTKTLIIPSVCPQVQSHFTAFGGHSLWPRDFQEVFCAPSSSTCDISPGQAFLAPQSSFQPGPHLRDLTLALERVNDSFRNFKLPLCQRKQTLTQIPSLIKCTATLRVNQQSLCVIFSTA